MARGNWTNHKKGFQVTRDINDPSFPHGEFRGWRRGCRCLECKRARADYNLQQKGVEKPKFRKLLGMEPSHPNFPHGTRTGYKYCKCDLCKEANNRYAVPLNYKRLQEKPEVKERYRATTRAWGKTERGRTIRKTSHAKRNALKRAINKCASADIELMRLIYLHCPEGYHVDHILPLSKGGLHHPDNLQYLPALINLNKRNNENFDCSKYAIRWQDHLDEPSTTIPKGSTLKRGEAPQNLDKTGS